MMNDPRQMHLTSDRLHDSLGIAETHRSSFESSMPGHYGPLIRRLVFVLGNEDDAKDIAQDAYLQAFRSWGRFDGSNPRGWLYTIAVRLAFNRLRARKRWHVPTRRIEPPAWDAPSDPDLWAALMTLDARPRAALVLNSRDGFTQAEVAHMMSVPEGTVSSWISRARRSQKRTGDSLEFGSARNQVELSA